MSKLSLKDISEQMRDIDICMMTTTSPRGLASRPMSNNREVEYDGDSYFFAYDSCSAAIALKANPKVNLGFVHEPLVSKSFYLSVTGQAKLIYDRATMEKHWVKDLEIWFEKGLDTPGIVLINVKAQHLKYWDGQDQSELEL